MAEKLMGLLVPVDGMPVRVEVEQNETGSCAKSLCSLVGCDILDVLGGILGPGIDVWCDDNGLSNGQRPNRAILATPYMESQGFVRQTDFKQVAKTGELYTALRGPLVILGADETRGTSVSLTDAELADMKIYFSEIAKPYSGLNAEWAVATDSPYGTSPEIFADKGFTGAGHEPNWEQPSSDLEEDFRAACDFLADVFDDFDPADIAVIGTNGVIRGDGGEER